MGSDDIGVMIYVALYSFCFSLLPNMVILYFVSSSENVLFTDYIW